MVSAHSDIRIFLVNIIILSDIIYVKKNLLTKNLDGVETKNLIQEGDIINEVTKFLRQRY